MNSLPLEEENFFFFWGGGGGGWGKCLVCFKATGQLVFECSLGFGAFLNDLHLFIYDIFCWYFPCSFQLWKHILRPSGGPREFLLDYLFHPYGDLENSLSKYLFHPYGDLENFC